VYDMSSTSSAQLRVHAIQTGTVAIKELQRDGGGADRRNLPRVFADSHWTEPLPIYAWLVEHPEGLLLVDTGETARVAERGYFPAWHPYFRLGVRESVPAEDEIGPQLQALGFSPDDVRWVVLTHFHTDHAGGLAHFPNSEILSSRADFEYSRGILGRMRGFLPQHWPEWFSPTLTEPSAAPFGPFARSLPLTAAGDVHLVPTPGHTPGHMSVAVEEGDTVLFFAGDASYTERLMLDGVADGVSPDPATARDTLARIRELTQQRPTVYLPAHDAEASTRLANRQPALARPQLARTSGSVTSNRTAPQLQPPVSGRSGIVRS
jgi:glyoxylase-like metal-dependent hydrolase (beta-lactamase superfamily II)